MCFFYPVILHNPRIVSPSELCFLCQVSLSLPLYLIRSFKSFFDAAYVVHFPISHVLICFLFFSFVGAQNLCNCSRR